MKSSRTTESLRSLPLTQMHKVGQGLLLQKHIPQASAFLLSEGGRIFLPLHHQSRGFNSLSSASTAVKSV